MGKSSYRNVTTEQIGKDIEGVVRTVLGLTDLDLSQTEPIIGMGAQSFDFMQIVVELEALYDVTIPKIYALPDNYSINDYVHAVMEAWRQNTTDGLA